MFRDLVENIDEWDGYSIEPKLHLDVPFVPTDDALITAMFKLAGLNKKDVLYDLGAGDGRIVITAAKQFGIKAVGIELDPMRISESLEDAMEAKVEHLVDLIEGSIFEADFSEATVVTLYLMDSVNVLLRPRLLSELHPGTRIVSHAFDMGDWQADEALELGGITLYKWVVPAQVAGVWQWESDEGHIYHLELQQQYQKVSGELWIDDRPAQLLQTKLEGCSLELAIQADLNQPIQHVLLSYENEEGPELEWL